MSKRRTTFREVNETRKATGGGCMLQVIIAFACIVVLVAAVPLLRAQDGEEPRWQMPVPQAPEEDRAAGTLIHPAHIDWMRADVEIDRAHVEAIERQTAAIKQLTGAVRESADQVAGAVSHQTAQLNARLTWFQEGVKGVSGKLDALQGVGEVLGDLRHEVRLLRVANQRLEREISQLRSHMGADAPAERRDR